jgi:Flp pilus assembly pilin Flp
MNNEADVTFWEDESGIGTIEMVLIMVVLIALILVFKDKIGELLEDIFDEIDSQASEVYKPY